MMKYYQIIIVTTFLILLTSCSFGETTPVVDLISPISPPATPTLAPLPTPTLYPTPKPPQSVEGVGIVYGQLVDRNNIPAKNVGIRLGGIVWVEGQEGDEGLVMSDKTRSPQARTDDGGYFVIEDIPTNDYGIVIDNPVDDESLFIFDSSKERLRVLNVKSGEVIFVSQLQLDIDLSHTVK
jgi:hypothetical protein